MTDDNDQKHDAEAKPSTDAPEAKPASEPAPAKASSEPPAKAASEPPPPAKAASEPPKSAKAASEPPKAAKASVDDAPAAHSPAPATLTPGARVWLAYSRKPGEPAAPPAKTSARLKPRRLLAEYDTTGEIIHAAKTMRDAGYKAFETHSPFPIHGMDAAMGLPDSRLGWIVLACGLTGVTSAWCLMYWTNAVDYPLIIGGKPPGALPSMVPIMFELTVLLSAFGAVFGMFGLNRLPQHHDVLFYSDRFSAFSNDKFFLSVESDDPKFNLEKTQQLLEKTKPQTIEVIETLEEVHS
jgi:hypothetical protein